MRTMKGGRITVQTTCSRLCIKKPKSSLKKNGSYLWFRFLIPEQSILHLMLLIKTSFVHLSISFPINIISNSFLLLFCCLLRQGFTMQC